MIAIYIFILKQIDGLAENFCLLKYAHAEVRFKCMLSFGKLDIDPRACPLIGIGTALMTSWQKVLKQVFNPY